jgi:hypothetical protein
MEGKVNIINYISQNFKNKKFLFIENDWDLHRELKLLEDILIDNKIKYHTMFNLSEIPIKAILEVISMADIIVWQSTYVTEISRSLLKLIDNYPNKIFIECPINEPLFYYKHDIVPDFYTLDIYEDNDHYWKLNKLSDKPIWEKGEDEV